MWLAWGGDAGFSWSRKIVNREKNMKKSYVQEEMLEEIQDILADTVEPFDTVIEIDDDEDIKKALRPEVTKEQLGMVIEHLMEAIEQMIEMPEEDEEEGEEMESEEMDGEEMESPENTGNTGSVVLLIVLPVIVLPLICVVNTPLTPLIVWKLIVPPVIVAPVMLLNPAD